MAVQGNLDGTRRDEFTVGKEEDRGLCVIGREVGLYDPENGAHALSELLAGGGSSIIETRGIITRAGGLVYSRPRSGGPIKLVVQNP